MSETCVFVGSPDSDELLDLVVAPALEHARWRLVQVDGAQDDALDRVEEAAVCVADTEALHPVSAYACGRRIGGSKPTILLAREGAGPLDPSAVTVEWDVGTPRAALDSRRRLERRLEEVAHRPSLSPVELALERLDRKLDRLLATSAPPAAAPAASGSSLLEITDPPNERLLAAVAADRVDEVVGLLPELWRLNPRSRETLTAAVVSATAGHEAGARALAELVSMNGTAWESLELKSAVGALVRFASRTDREQDVLDWCGASLEEIAARRTLPDDDRSYLLNQLQMLYWGIDDMARAEELTRAAIALSPGVPAYKFNLSLILEAVGRLDEAERLVEEFMEQPGAHTNGDYLGQAVDVYLKRGRESDALDLFEELREVDPDKARVRATFNADLRRLLEPSKP